MTDKTALLSSVASHLRHENVTLLYSAQEASHRLATALEAWLREELRLLEAANEQKRKLRADLLAGLAQMRREDIIVSDQRVTSQILSSARFRSARALFCYVSVGSELDTRVLISQALAAGKTVYVPRCLDGQRMKALQLCSLEDLKPGMYGIPEPPADASEMLQADLALIPCLAASKDGGRLGHGAGYYDVFLRQHALYKLCLCHREAYLDTLPMTSLDVPMNAVATPDGIYACVTSPGER